MGIGLDEHLDAAFHRRDRAASQGADWALDAEVYVFRKPAQARIAKAVADLIAIVEDCRDEVTKGDSTEPADGTPENFVDAIIALSEWVDNKELIANEIRGMSVAPLFVEKVIR